MDERKENLLISIVEEFTKTALPVGSKVLAKSGKFDVSPATIRNEMAELETEGYIFQPHTSAGRVPTEKAYQYYVERFVHGVTPSSAEKNELQKFATKISDERPIKSMAKKIAEITGQAVILGLSEHDTYYTGLTNLFSQPEFRDIDYVYGMSEIIDHLDEVISRIYNDMPHSINVYIGDKNPFGTKCSTIVTGYKNARYGGGIIGLLGPTRMDYRKNYALLSFSRELINKL